MLRGGPASGTPPLKNSLLPLKTKKNEQSLKEKSASEGSGSPVLQQVRESTTTTPRALARCRHRCSLRVREGQTSPCGDIRAVHLREMQLALC